jgi:hypothetical protein
MYSIVFLVALAQVLGSFSAVLSVVPPLITSWEPVSRSSSVAPPSISVPSSDAVPETRMLCYRGHLTPGDYEFWDAATYNYEIELFVDFLLSTADFYIRLTPRIRRLGPAGKSSVCHSVPIEITPGQISIDGTNHCMQGLGEMVGKRLVPTVLIYHQAIDALSFMSVYLYPDTCKVLTGLSPDSPRLTLDPAIVTAASPPARTWAQVVSGESVQPASSPRTPRTPLSLRLPSWDSLEDDNYDKYLWETIISPRYFGRSKNSRPKRRNRK